MACYNRLVVHTLTPFCIHAGFHNSIFIQDGGIRQIVEYNWVVGEVKVQISARLEQVKQEIWEESGFSSHELSFTPKAPLSAGLPILFQSVNHQASHTSRDFLEVFFYNVQQIFIKEADLKTSTENLRQIEPGRAFHLASFHHIGLLIGVHHGVKCKK